MRKTFLNYITVLLTLAGISLSSGCDITADAPDLTYFLNNEWRAKEITINGARPSGEEAGLDKLYRLQLNQDFTFTEIDISEDRTAVTREGLWRLENNATIIILEYNDGFEKQLIIVEVQIRQLTLRRILDDAKSGTLDFLYVLVPVRR